MVTRDQRIHRANERAKAAIQRALQCMAWSAERQQLIRSRVQELNQRIEHFLVHLAELKKSSK